jgi:hypothetical protein
MRHSENWGLTKPPTYAIIPTESEVNAMTKYRVKAIFLPTGKVKTMMCGSAGLDALKQSEHWHIFDIKVFVIEESV